MNLPNKLTVRTDLRDPSIYCCISDGIPLRCDGDFSFWPPLLMSLDGKINPQKCNLVTNFVTDGSLADKLLVVSAPPVCLAQIGDALAGWSSYFRTSLLLQECVR